MIKKFKTKWEILDLLKKETEESGKVQLKNNYGEVHLIGGALGELEGCAAFEEYVLKSPMWRTKYYGISYWFKGIADNDIIDRATITKRAIIETALLFKYLLPLILVFRKKFIRDFQKLILQIYRVEGGLKERCLKLEEFCPFCQELIKAGLKVFKDEDLIYCVAMFLQFSPSYRMRGQDGLSLIIQHNLKKKFFRELLRIRKEILSRERVLYPKFDTIRQAPTRKKMSIMIWGMILFALLNKKKVKQFLMELDYDKVKIDEADWYFCLRKEQYNFGGYTLEERLKEAERIDKEKEHLILGL